MTSISKIGFIGLGAMGGALARRLIRNGIAPYVFDIRPEAVAEIVGLGGVSCDSPRDVADQAELIFACLPDARVCIDTALGAHGVLAGTTVKVYVECSTIGSEAITEIHERLKEKGIHFLDAPVSGGPRGAEAGSLAVMVAGRAESVAIARPFIDLLGSSVFVVGEVPGQAQVMKLVNNLISASNMAAAYEGMVMGAKAGLDPEVMIQVLNASTGRNSATETKIPKAILNRQFNYGATIEIFYKDVSLGLKEAERLGVPMWVGNNVAQLWRYAVLQGGAKDDFTTLIRHMEQWAGVEVRSKERG